MLVTTSGIALKEWAVIVEALARGQQCLLLRKGGIADPDETFELAHREFFLFPTFEHQRREQIRPEFHPLFDEVVKRPPPAGPRAVVPPPLAAATGQVLLPLYAGVAGSWRVKKSEALSGLERMHIWTRDFLATRLSYKPEIPTLAVLVRAYRLHKPPTILNTPEYAGCKSWVPLAEPLPVDGAIPVIPNLQFRQLLEAASAHFDAVA